MAKEEFARSINIASMTNHALLSGGEFYLSRTSEIYVPALIIHGTEDPIIPYEHGKHLKHVIPRSVLLTLEGAGYEFHEDDWDVVITAIKNHAAAID